MVKGEIGLHIEKKTVPTFKEAIADFLKWVEFERKPNTYLQHQSSSKVLLRDFGKLKVDEITPETVEKFVMKRSKEFRHSRGRKPKAKRFNQVSTAHSGKSEETRAAKNFPVHFES
ncbi:MAG: hypothetical protein ABJA66_09505 [Actinomycetota bacterium]